MTATLSNRRIDETAHLLGNDEVDEPKPSWMKSWDNRMGERNFALKLLATSLNYFISGVIVTALGALIPSLESYYDIKDSAVSIIFPCTLGGYLCSTVSIQFVHLYAGRRGLGLLSSVFRILPLLLLSFGLSFPVSVAAYTILGFGVGLTDSGWSAWGATLQYPNIAQGILHGSFGLGATCGPLISVAFINNGRQWTEIYRLLQWLVVFEMVVQLWAFRYDTARLYKNLSRNVEDHNDNGLCHETGVSNPFQHIATWLCCLFLFVYVSIEFTYSDWIVVYMRRARHTPYTIAGLASSIFWIGMSSGRLFLGPVSERYGVQRCLFVYLTASAFLQILFMSIHDTTAGLIILGLNGFFVGPTFPSALTMLSYGIPRGVVVAAVSAAAAMGQIGAASVPFGVGYMAEHVGIERLLDVVLTLTIALLAVWVLFTRTIERNRSDLDAEDSEISQEQPVSSR